VKQLHITLGGLGLLGLLWLTGAAGAETDNFWQGPDGGVYSSPTHWTNGLPDDDTHDAVFNDTGTYTVDVDGGFSSNRIEVINGDVTLNFLDTENDELTYTRGGAGDPRGFLVGGGDGATLRINGRIIEDGNGYGDVGYGYGTTGRVVVDGPDAYLRGKITVGDHGSGTVDVLNGGRFYIRGAGYLGWDEYGSGTINVDGADSSLATQGTMIVGWNGDGAINLSDGARGDFNPTFGADNGGFGTGLITGAGTLLRTFTNTSGTYNKIVVGGRGRGELTVSDGAAIEAYYRLVVGESSRGRLHVDNATAWGQNVYVGDWGHGEINITSGGRVYGRSVRIAQRDSAEGAVTVSGTGSKLDATQFGISIGTDVGLGGLTLTNGGTASSVHDTVIQRNGHLAGNSTITAPNVINHGTVAPSMRYSLDENHQFTETLDRTPFLAAQLGGGGISTHLTIDGNYQQTATGSLDIHFDQYGWDKLSVTGSTALDGVLNLSFADNFTLPPDAYFDILTSGSAVTGTFTDLAEGDKVGSFNGSDLFITYNPITGPGVSLFALEAPAPPPAQDEPIRIENIGRFGELNHGSSHQLFTSTRDAFGNIQDNTTTINNFNVNNQAWVSMHATYDNFLGVREAEAYAAMSTSIGLNRMTLDTWTDAPNFTKPYATGSSTWYDHIVVLGGEGEEEMTVRFSLDGSMQADDGSSLMFILRVTTLNDDGSTDSTVSASEILTYLTHGDTDTFHSYVEAVIPFTYGQAIRLDTTIFASSWLDGGLDFSGTAKVDSVILPDGATAYSSAVQSGQTTTAAYNDGVALQVIPEPGTAVLLLAGTGCMWRRRAA